MGGLRIQLGAPAPAPAPSPIAIDVGRGRLWTTGRNIVTSQQLAVASRRLALTGRNIGLSLGNTALFMAGDGAVDCMPYWDLGGGGTTTPGTPKLPIYGTGNGGVTYFFEVLPYLKSTSNSSTTVNTSNPRYWTLFFWGNYNKGAIRTPLSGNGIFQWNGGAADSYYGGHPYPFGGAGAPFGIPQRPEVSAYGNDYDAGVEWTWGSWIRCMFTAERQSANVTRHRFYYDIDRSPGTFLEGSLDFSSWGHTNPPNPVITICQSAWNTYTGNESFAGYIRNIGFADDLMTESEVASEMTSPLTTSADLFYRKVNPDLAMTDQGPHGNTPTIWGTLDVRSV